MENESVGQREETNKRSEAGSVEEPESCMHWGWGMGTTPTASNATLALASMAGCTKRRDPFHLENMQVKTPPGSRVPIHDAFQAALPPFFLFFLQTKIPC
jgi:hypothetical protein